MVEPQGEARANWQVFAMLGRAMGLQDEPFGWDERTHFEKAAAGLRLSGGALPDGALEDAGQVRHQFGGEPTPIGFVNVFPPGNRVDLAPAILGERPFVHQTMESEDHPLALISPASHKLVSSTFGEFNLARLTVTLNPIDAAGLESGATVRVFNDLGEVLCPLVISETVAPGCALMPKGAWRRATDNGKTAAALCPDHVEAVSGGACFNDARVRVVAVH